MMKKTRSQSTAPASEDLIIDFGSTRHRRTKYYETTINALTLENDKFIEEHDSLTNDMIALSHECCELEREWSLESSANEKLRRTIEVLSYKCEELVQGSQKHQPSDETIEVQQMKQKLKNAAEERKLLEERVAALERESTETDSYIQFLERNHNTETPASASKKSERWSSWTNTTQNEQNPRSSQSFSSLPEPSAGKASIIKEERRHRRTDSLEIALNFCKSALLVPIHYCCETELKPVQQESAVYSCSETEPNVTIRPAAAYTDDDFIYEHSHYINR
jgi:phage shock protein A